MKEYYYYVRDIENKPRVTVCLMIDGEKISKGMAICCYKDNPCKKMGRKIARERAKFAFLEERDVCITKRKELFLYPFKANFMPILTEHEKKILFPRILNLEINDR